MEQNQKRRKAEHNLSKLSIVMFLLLCVTIITIVFLVYFKSVHMDSKSFGLNNAIKGKSQGTALSNSVETLGEFKNEYKEHTDFAAFKDIIIKCTKDSILWLNKNGEELKVKIISLENPVMKISGAYLLIADIGGKEFYVINGMNIKWTKKSDTNIINADIDSNGFVSIVKEKKGYKGAIDIYNKNGNIVFTTVRSGSFVLGARIFSTEDKVLINKVDASGISANSNLEFVNLGAEQMSKSLQEENVIFSNLWNLNGDYIIGVSDNALVCYDMKLEKKWKKSFNQIFSSVLALGKYTVVACEMEDKSVLTSKSGTDIKMINSIGKDIATYTLNSNVINIDCIGNLVAINTGNEIDFINTSGKLVGKYSSKSEVLKADFFDNREVMVQTQKSITILKIRGH